MKTHKRCPRCKETKVVAEFGKNLGAWDCLRSACKKCEAASQRAKTRQRIAERTGTAPFVKPPEAIGYEYAHPGSGRLLSASPVLLDPDATPPVLFDEPAAPAPAPLPPLENAFHEHAEAAAKRDLKKEHKALLDEVKRQRALLEAIRPLHGPSHSVIPPAPAPEKGEAVPLILFSDWHLEEEVDREKMHGVNEYNLVIAEQRAQAAFRNALRLMELAARDSLVRRAVVGLLGDFFSGSIHLELMEVNQLGPQPAARFAKDQIAAGIRYWLANSDLTFEFNCVAGNHGRMTEKTRISTNAENSLEIFMYHFLATEFEKEPRVTFRVATGDMLYSDIFPGYRVRFIHGDQIKSNGGIGGVTIPLNKWIMRQDMAIPAQLTGLGHFHQSFDGGSFLLNGSLIGASPYSQRFGFSPEPPQQKFALISASRGKSIVAPIWCTP